MKLQGSWARNVERRKYGGKKTSYLLLQTQKKDSLQMKLPDLYELHHSNQSVAAIIPLSPA